MRVKFDLRGLFLLNLGLVFSFFEDLKFDALLVFVGGFKPLVGVKF